MSRKSSFEIFLRSSTFLFIFFTSIILTEKLKSLYYTKEGFLFRAKGIVKAYFYCS